METIPRLAGWSFLFARRTTPLHHIALREVCEFAHLEVNHRIKPRNYPAGGIPI
jgi:hypothetical protein